MSTFEERRKGRRIRVPTERDEKEVAERADTQQLTHTVPPYRFDRIRSHIAAHERCHLLSQKKSKDGKEGKPQEDVRITFIVTLADAKYVFSSPLGFRKKEFYESLYTRDSY